AVCSLDATAGKGSGFAHLAGCLAWLAARGHAVELAAWDPVEEAAQTSRPTHTVELCGANYVKPRAPRPPLTPPRPIATPIANGSPPPAKMNPPADSSLDRALEVTRETLAALQRMQEQTAQLHPQFLDSQDHAQRTVQQLVEQQQRLLQASLGLPVAPATLPPVVPAPPAAVPAPV